MKTARAEFLRGATSLFCHLSQHFENFEFSVELSNDSRSRETGVYLRRYGMGIARSAKDYEIAASQDPFFMGFRVANEMALRMWPGERAWDKPGLLETLRGPGRIEGKPAGRPVPIE